MQKKDRQPTLSLCLQRVIPLCDRTVNVPFLAVRNYEQQTYLHQSSEKRTPFIMHSRFKGSKGKALSGATSQPLSHEDSVHRDQ